MCGFTLTHQINTEPALERLEITEHFNLKRFLRMVQPDAFLVNGKKYYILADLEEKAKPYLSQFRRNKSLLDSAR